ncbi:low affinity iron permease family protein [Phyllobacterium sp. 21LDTY02-6]|nr:low affinity iron permease family protein [Phyllobacterium sp. 21LDTY02-6]MCO4317707.1 low affinity iron permease family protein [Phyllobacterium sp. 21LDTY02-6]
MHGLRGVATLNQFFTNIANYVAMLAGRPLTFILCVTIVIVWAVSGPIFGFSDTWQLIINTGTTIITFLMVFLIQNTQNRDSVALQTKLDELLRVSKAKNSFIGIEHLTEEEVEAYREQSEAAAKKADAEMERRSRKRASKRTGPAKSANAQTGTKANARARGQKSGSQAAKSTV